MKKPLCGRNFTQSVVMVDRVDKKIPRGYQRSLLQEKGFMVSFIDFWTSWSKKDVRDAIESEAVPDTSCMHARVGYKCAQIFLTTWGLDFLQSCEGNLVYPVLPPAHIWTGDKIHRLAGQGCLYICPTYDCLIARVRFIGI